MTLKHLAIAHPMFDQYAEMCMSTPDLVDGFNRLYGANVNFGGRKRSGIESLVDTACGLDAFGNTPEDVKAFLDFVCDTFVRVPELQESFTYLANELLAGMKPAEAA